jgi:MFS-type transporter involved in bile tolerance (Atg22 family)
MANIFLASSFIFLACDEAGGIDPDDGTCDEDATARGFKPSALIANIAVISGILSAIFMPFFGAIIDYTDHRKLTGILSAFLLIAIQAVQIGTVAQTWFTMAILQAIAGFIYQVQVVSNYAYLPEIAREVGQSSMNNFTAIFTQSQFLSQALFNIVVIGISVGFSMDTVVTGMAGQVVCVAWGVVFFPWGWRMLPARPARHTLQEGQWMLTAGFTQNWRTTKAIWVRYRKGLKWYLLALIFAEASAAATTNLAVIYLSDTVGLNGTQIGIFFLVALFCTIPGAWIGSKITHRTNPNTSWKLCQLTLAAATIVGAMFLEDIKGPKELSYIWAACIGLLLGWFYPTENLFFSMCLPKGQEAELAGFFVYCTQILGWLPPLLFSILVQAGVAQKWGVVVTSFGYVVAVLFLSCTGSWEEILDEAEHNKGVHLVEASAELNAADDSDTKGETKKEASDDEEVSA